jgi:hypothetical protein
MTRQQSEGVVHVEAMRLILEAMERREDPPDWTVLTHMLGLLESIFQGIEDQRRDDQDELMHVRKDRDARQAEIERLLQMVANLQYNRDYWKKAMQNAIEAGELLRAEIETLRSATAADEPYQWQVGDEVKRDDGTIHTISQAIGGLLWFKDQTIGVCEQWRLAEDGYQLHRKASDVPLTPQQVAEFPAVTEPIDDSVGTDGEGQ